MAGDVNGDGIADVLVWAPSADNNGRTHSGSAFVIFGHRGPSHDVNVGDLGDRGFRIDGARPGSRLGAGSGVGDFNRDGRSDVVVVDQPEGSAFPTAYVVFGKAGTAGVDLGASTGEWFQITGLEGSDSENSVAAARAGDVNGDGFADLIVGDRNYGGDAPPGRSFVIFGGRATASLDIDHLGRRGLVILGARAGDRSGYAVSPAGDVNGDHLGDIAISALRDSGAQNRSSGVVYVIYGSRSARALHLSHLARRGYAMSRGENGDGLGSALAGGEDLNGDGGPDLAIGAPGRGRGAVYVVYGSRSRATRRTRLLRADGFRVDGTGASNDIGGTVAEVRSFIEPAGSVVIGAPGARTESGEVYVLPGKLPRRR